MISTNVQTVLIGYLICLALPLAGNQTPTAAPVQPASDNFIGEWKLNVASSSPTAENEVLKIEPDGSGYKFTDERTFAKGKPSHRWFVTNMKGPCVQSFDSNGKNPAKACFTRLDSNSFINDVIVWIDRYQVNGDHNTLTMTRTWKLKPDGKTPRVHAVVYDRVKSETP
jgi:hypothetical protein